MSVGHSETCFNHSCLKVPVDSSNRGRFSKYERISSAENSGKEDALTKPNFKISKYCSSNFQTVRSYLKFYESIPDYTDLHHLSNEEFYSQLKSLKITQKRFYRESTVWDFCSRSDNINEKTTKNNASESNVCCSGCCLHKSFCKTFNDEKKSNFEKTKTTTPKINVISDNENCSELYESEYKKNSDYEADQESSTLQLGDKFKKNSRNYLSVRDEYLMGCYSKPTSLPFSSGCECETPEFCHRTPEINFRDDRCWSGYCSAQEKPLGKKPQQHQTQSLPIPLTSRIPLYDKIMEEKEARRKAIHERYSEKLRSLVQPFSFTKREEENKRLRMVRSNPELSSLNGPVVRFKAKPIPKNLFSNYAYERMREDEFYRALKRRVRAEELLKSSSLPPSMALRERKYLSKSLDFIDDDGQSSGKHWNGKCGVFNRACKGIRQSIHFDEKSKGNASKSKNLGWLLNKSRCRRIGASVTDSSTEVSPYESVLGDSRRKARPHSAFSSSRSNLASVLRIETARKRLETEMKEKLMENRMKDEARLKARLVRMSPEWKALSYDKEEDLALRLAARREEERMKQERHDKSMASMYGRVYRMPPLFHKERFHSANISKKNKSSMRNASPCRLNIGNDTNGNQIADEIVYEARNGCSNNLSLPESAELEDKRSSQSTDQSMCDRREKYSKDSKENCETGQSEE